jgi:hypothetical protein
VVSQTSLTQKIKKISQQCCQKIVELKLESFPPHIEDTLLGIVQMLLDMKNYVGCKFFGKTF